MANRRFEFILSATTQGWNRINQARAGLNAFTREVRSGSSQLDDMRGKIALLSGAAIGLAGVLGAGFGVSSMVTDVVAGNKELKNMAETAGLSVGDFAAYAHAVQSVGIESDKLADISKDVKDKIGDFIETGGGEFKDFFENVATQAGLTAEELIKMSGPDALMAVKKAMDDVNISAESQVFYLESLANDASLLIPLLENEGRALKELANNAREMGVSISDLDHKSLLELNDVLVEFRTNMGVTRREIVLALAPAIQQMAEYLAENNEEIREFAVAIAESAGETVKWVLENRSAIITVGKLVAGMWLLTKGVQIATTTIRGVRAAALALTGTSLVSWLGLLRGAMIRLTLAMATNPLVAVGVAALYVGIQLKGLIDRYYELEKLNADIEAQTRSNAAANKELSDRFREISDATGVAITSMEELDQAVKDGTLRFDDVAGQWVAGYGEISESAKGSAKEQKAAMVKVTDEMKKAYQKYADEVRRIQGEIAGGERSLAAQLRDMARTGMSDIAAWRDRKKEAGEFYLASKKALAEAEAALAAGDKVTAKDKFAEAKQLADESKAAYADLNKAVESNGKVVISQQSALKTAMNGVQDAGRLGIEILKSQEEAAIAAGKALDAASGGQLAKMLPEAAKAFGELNEQAEELGRRSAEFNQAWNDTWDDFLKDGKGAIHDLDTKLSQLTKDRHIKVYVREVAQKAAGGLAGVPGFATGGSPSTNWQQFRRLSNPYITRGSGIRDDVPAMLKKYEFVQPDTSVHYYGLRFMEMIRRRMFPRELARGFATGGSPSGPVSLSGSSGGGAGLVIQNQSFHFAGEVSRQSKQNARDLARQVLRELEKMYKGSSQ